ncbi:cobalt-precorrin 5A hydrolase [Shimia gijangensis]|uniref:Cobalt-precorrin 5A hydrolase n=2 Tax=Shimia gijangensis TaxID=1470563 RepID=A0A1M6LNB1_9RHOB|nr:cobalt-precorrin 5A hydrolase [Shimia gijangensis]
MIVAGFGFRRTATVASLRAALTATAPKGVEMLAAPVDKAFAECLQTLAREMSLPVQPVQDEALQAVETTTLSEVSQSHRGTGSVAEACALVAAGPQAELLTTRQVSPDRMATCAIAKGPRV